MIGDDVEVIVVEIRGDKVRLGINAPSDLPIHRHEVYEAIKREHGEVRVGMSDRASTLNHMAALAFKLKANLVRESKELNWLVKTIDLWLLDLSKEQTKESA